MINDDVDDVDGDENGDDRVNVTLYVFTTNNDEGIVIVGLFIVK